MIRAGRVSLLGGERFQQVAQGFLLGGGERGQRGLVAQAFEHGGPAALAFRGEHDLFGAPVGRVRPALDQALLFEPVEDEGRVGRFASHSGRQLAGGDRLGQLTQRDDLRRGETELVGDAADVNVEPLRQPVDKLAYVAVELGIR